MNLSKFTVKSQEALADAQNIAYEYDNQEYNLGPSFICFG
jgi:ATP-dependent Clp protease ATP-binding subunit ClpB